MCLRERTVENDRHEVGASRISIRLCRSGRARGHAHGVLARACAAARTAGAGHRGQGNDARHADSCVRGRHGRGDQQRCGEIADRWTTRACVGPGWRHGETRTAVVSHRSAPERVGVARSAGDACKRPDRIDPGALAGAALRTGCREALHLGRPDGAIPHQSQFVGGGITPEAIENALYNASRRPTSSGC